GDASAFEASRQLEVEQDVGQLGHRVLVKARYRCGWLGERVPLQPVLRPDVGAACNDDDTCGCTCFQLVEQQGRQQKGSHMVDAEVWLEAMLGQRFLTGEPCVVDEDIDGMVALGQVA